MTEVRLIPPLLQAIYGDSFTHKIFYDTKKLTKMILAERGSFFLAIETQSGQAVGILGLFFDGQERLSLEICLLAINAAIASPESGVILKKMMQAVRSKLMALSKQFSLRTFYTYGTTTHQLIQSLCEMMGFRLTGILQGHIAAWAEQLKHSPVHERQSDLVYVYQVKSNAKPYPLFLPERYADLITRIYQRLGSPAFFLKVGVAKSLGIQPKKTLFKLEHRFQVKLGVLEVIAVGQNFLEDMRRAMHRALSLDLEIIHFFLSLEQSEIHFAVEALVTLGACFAAVIPFYRQSDVLIMQYVKNPMPDFASTVFTDSIDQAIYFTAMR